MARYIDAEEAIRRIDLYIENGSVFKSVLRSIKRLINNVPTADVIEVIRCKNCRYGEIDDLDIPNQYLCHYDGESWNDENHYCSYGKKVE